MQANAPNVLVSAWFPTTPGALSAAWLDADAHTAMTGGRAEVAPVERSAFTAWDGYIEGTLIEIEHERRILMTWRTTDFAPDDGDSLVELTFSRAHGGTQLWLHHTDIPRSQGTRYRAGWRDFYVRPMTEYFTAFLAR